MSEPGNSTYWCAEDQDKFAQTYFAKAQQLGGLSGYGVLTSLQRLAYRHYYGALPINFLGDMPSSAMAGREGSQGQNVTVRVNQFHIHVNAKHQIIVAPKLAWGVSATNSDQQPMVDSARGGDILEWAWKSTPLEQMAVDAELNAGLAGEDFIVTLWDKQAGKAKRRVDANGNTVQPGQLGPDGKPVPATIEYAGDLKAFSVPSWCVIRQHSAKSWEASPWACAQIPRNRYDMIAQHPDMEAELLACPAAITNNGDQTALETGSDPDIITVHYFFHDKTPSLPLGLQVVLCSPTCVLEFEALEACYSHRPIHRFVDRNLKGTPYGYTTAWEAMGIQDLITDIQGSLATNIVVFAKQMIVVEEGTNLPPDQLGNGPTILYKPKQSADPVALALYAAQPEMFKHLERLTGDMRSTFGLNDMAMGVPPQGPPNAQAWALLATANITNNSQGQRHYVDAVRSIGRSWLAIFKAKLDEKRKASIVGKFGASTAEQVEFDKSDLQGFDDVSVDIDNPLLQTAAGRLPIAQMYQEGGFVQVPEQIETLVTTGKLTPLTQVLRNEINFIAGENEALLRGETPQVLLSDSHQLHIREHKDAMFLPKARADEAVINAYNAHLNAHVEMDLQMSPQLHVLLGQAAPPQPAPPAGTPPAAGGGSPKGEKRAAAALAPPGSAAQGEASKIPIPSSPTDLPVNPAQ